MTYSVIAHDPESGAYGVGVQSHWFNVGRTAPWVRFGIGAIATQAMTDPSYGWRGLDIMAAGVDAPTALRVLMDMDTDSDRRQVGFIDAHGRVAVHTGARCLRHADHSVGEGWAVLGNLLANEDVIPRMAEAFENAEGTLAERMVASLEAAELAGGDVRGRQSAAIKIAPGSLELAHGDEPGVEILIADHPHPVMELRRLIEVDRSYRFLRQGNSAIEDGRVDEGLELLEHAANLRHGGEVDFWSAIGLARSGRTSEAGEMLERVFRKLPNFRLVLERLIEVEPALELLYQHRPDLSAGVESP